MDDKLREIYKKYYDVKTNSIIEKHFKSKFSVDAWIELKQAMDNEYLRIVNKSAWSLDFPYGGTDKIYLTQLFFNPYTHAYDEERDIETTGNTAIADACNLIRMCNDYMMDEIHIMDFTSFVIIAAWMVAGSDGIGFARSAKMGWYSSIFPKRIKWLAKYIQQHLVLPADISNTKIIINMQSMWDVLAKVKAFNFKYEDVYRLNRRIERNRHFVNSKCLMQRVYLRIPYVLTAWISAMYSSVFSTKFSKLRVAKPILVYTDSYTTDLEKFIITREELAKTMSAAIYKIHKFGMPTVIDTLRETLKKEDVDKLNYLIEMGNPLPHPLRLDIRQENKIKEIWEYAPRGRFIKTRNESAIQDYYYTKTKSPLATCIIDMDKLMFENSTKDKSWILSMAVLLYSNAQEINALRASFQTMMTNNELLVEIISSDDDIRKELEERINATNELLISNEMCKFTYEIRKADKNERKF